jgi:hypothetical protein
MKTPNQSACFRVDLATPEHNLPAAFGSVLRETSSTAIQSGGPSAGRFELLLDNLNLIQQCGNILDVYI